MVERRARRPLPAVRFLVIFVATALIAWFVLVAIRTQGFGALSIRGESYYPEIVKRITTDSAFIAALGSPVTVDASGVVCDYKAFDSGGVTQKASCYLPVSGPKGNSNVHVQLLSRPGALDADSFLHVGSTVIKGKN